MSRKIKSWRPFGHPNDLFTFVTVVYLNLRATSSGSIIACCFYIISLSRLQSYIIYTHTYIRVRITHHGASSRPKSHG